MTLPNIDELIEKLLSSAKAFRENWIYTQDGDPVLLAVQAEELEQASSALSTLQERRDTLFDAIQHGDQDHKDWLREAIAAHFAGEPVPVPRGSGNKEAMISTLQEQKRKLEEALRAILAMPGTHLLRGTHNTPNCEHPLCIARALLGDGA